MPVVATNLTTAGSASNSTTYTTASMSVGPNTVIIATVGGDGTNGTTSLAGLGLTWTQVDTKQDAGTARRITMFRAAPIGGATGTVVITWSAAATNGCNWTFTSFSNVDVSGTNGANAVVQFADGTVDTKKTITVTLAAFTSANNATYGVLFINANFAITHGSGFTELGQDNTLRSIEAEFRNDNDTTVDWTWGTDAVGVAIAIEIKFAITPTSAFLMELM